MGLGAATRDEIGTKGMSSVGRLWMIWKLHNVKIKGLLKSKELKI